jgi:hypothetical protein
MSHITKWIGKLLFGAMTLALITYAASRTLAFVSGTLSPEDQAVGFLTLFATTGGGLAWLSVFLWSSEGVAQKGIALVMIVLDVGGELAIFTIEALKVSGENGMIATLAPEEIRMTVLGMSLLIGANIAATFAFHIFEPKNLKHIEEHFAEWKIEQAILKAKVAKAESIANEIAEREAEAYAIEQRSKDRRDHAQDERTAGEVFSGMVDKLPAWMKSKPREAMPLVAAEAEQVKLQEPTEPTKAEISEGGQENSFHHLSA